MTGLNVKKIFGEVDIHRIVVAGDEPEAPVSGILFK
jgi:hypothetical protein